jgi:putative hemolysin
MEGAMIHRTGFGVSLALLLIASACGGGGNGGGTATPQVALPNPASVFCEEHGGQVDLRTDQTGAVTGYCLFADGSECEEWAYFRGECKPGDSLVTPAALPESGELAADGWRVYRDPELGLSFHYPPNSTVQVSSGVSASLQITGPAEDGESWPQFVISHPTPPGGYHPPKGIDLGQWLTDSELLGDTRLADAAIAGESAVHLRHDRSPQSYAYDRYYFDHDGQLFMVVIGHAGDKEDWDLYNHFLQSFRFDS